MLNLTEVVRAYARAIEDPTAALACQRTLLHAPFLGRGFWMLLKQLNVHRTEELTIAGRLACIYGADLNGLLVAAEAVDAEIAGWVPWVSQDTKTLLSQTTYMTLRAVQECHRRDKPGHYRRCGAPSGSSWEMAETDVQNERFVEYAAQVRLCIVGFGLPTALDPAIETFAA